MSNHTPGPWKWLESEYHGGFYGLYSGDEPVVYPQRCNDGDDGDAWFSTDENEAGETALKPADAKLIEAAPDMLEALKMAVANMRAFAVEVDDNIENWPEYQAAMAAIAKAEGE